MSLTYRSLNNLLLLSAAFAIAAFVTWRVRLYALKAGRLDVPNQRSSHIEPTPRGGGLSIVIVVTAASGVLLSSGSAIDFGVAVCAMMGGLVAAIGYFDDSRGLAAAWRFLVHAIAATGLVAVVVGSHGTEVFFPTLPGWVVRVLLIVGTMWSINLFNFMDGIDGIAASEAIFVALGAAILSFATSGASPWITMCFALAGATGGFLVWNWPPARIFMGDVGSGFVGFWLAALAIGMHVAGLLSIWTFVTLAAAFIADATITLLRRLVRGERIFEAHRSHAYQVLARRWGNHRAVTLAVCVLNLVILVPAAFLTVVQPSAAPFVALAIVALLSVVCLVIQARQYERAGS